MGKTLQVNDRVRVYGYSKNGYYFQGQKGTVNLVVSTNSNEEAEIRMDDGALDVVSTIQCKKLKTKSFEFEAVWREHENIGLIYPSETSKTIVPLIGKRTRVKIYVLD